MAKEVALILVPLLILLIGLTVDELKTGVIRDIVTLPAFIYLLATRMIIGPQAWYVYPLAAASLVAMFSLAFVSVPRMFGREEWVGIGAIKLLGVVGVALGLPDAWWLGGIFVLIAAIWLLVAIALKVHMVPSSPLVGLSFVLIMVHRLLSSTV